ncbi:kinase-like domain-containing protein [Lyophyllum atratum]|nr:kinase-like domain-containing protein [Lyophyllum atratum]
MRPTTIKRHASSSPAGERATKRLATSSPEEGELDDAEPFPHTLPPLPACLPAKPDNYRPRSPSPVRRSPPPHEPPALPPTPPPLKPASTPPPPPPAFTPPPPPPPDSRLVKDATREPIRRSKKEEMEAYGRIFGGCGMQADYEVTTKLGEGTFGEVHKAIHKETGNIVALKRILMHNEKEGMPVTALREIKILKALRHSCIVNILDMFVVRSTSKDPLSVYMVFPYMDHDLAGLLENDRVKLQPSHIKLYMKQLLEGTEYMHHNHILHRDMKAANLLISNTGSLQIADFGLARAFDVNVTRNSIDGRVKERKYTNCVVTRWYRPPELLMGARQYGGEVDMWGIGCVLGEMFSRRPILPGNSDLDQLEKIWQLCGSPNQHSWPHYDALPGCEGVKRFQTHSRRIRQTYESVGSETCDLLDKLLTCNPRERITASQALNHDYFWTDPLPADPKTLPSYEASHEFDKRGQRNHHPPANVQPLPPHEPHNLHNPAFRGRPGPDFNAPHGPTMHRNPAPRNMPYPPHPPQGPQHGSGGLPLPGFIQDPYTRNPHLNPHPPQHPRFNGGGGRGPPPPHHNNNPNIRGRGPGPSHGHDQRRDDWRGGPRPPLPSGLPQRPSAPQGLLPTHPRDHDFPRRGDSSLPPPTGGGDDKLNYD